MGNNDKPVTMVAGFDTNEVWLMGEDGVMAIWADTKPPLFPYQVYLFPGDPESANQKLRQAMFERPDDFGPLEKVEWDFRHSCVKGGYAEPLDRDGGGGEIPVTVTVRFEILVPAGTDIEGIYIDLPLDTPDFLDHNDKVVAQGAVEFETVKVERYEE